MLKIKRWGIICMTGFHALLSGHSTYKPSKNKSNLLAKKNCLQKPQMKSAIYAHTKLKKKLVSHICSLSGWTFCFQVVIVKGWEQLHECFLSTGVRLPKIPEHVLVIDTI